jgi:hypothetical protein
MLHFDVAVVTLAQRQIHAITMKLEYFLLFCALITLRLEIF